MTVKAAGAGAHMSVFSDALERLNGLLSNGLEEQCSKIRALLKNSGIKISRVPKPNSNQDIVFRSAAGGVTKLGELNPEFQQELNDVQAELLKRQEQKRRVQMATSVSRDSIAFSAVKGSGSKDCITGTPSAPPHDM